METPKENIFVRMWYYQRLIKVFDLFWNSRQKLHVNFLMFMLMFFFSKISPQIYPAQNCFLYCSRMKFLFCELHLKRTRNAWIMQEVNKHFLTMLPGLLSKRTKFSHQTYPYNNSLLQPGINIDVFVSGAIVWKTKMKFLTLISAVLIMGIEAQVFFSNHNN